MSGYRQACIPAGLAKEVVRIAREHPEFGYRTLSEFVRTATIEHMRQVHTQLALNALWATAELGADAVHALIGFVAGGLLGGAGGVEGGS